MVMCVGVIVLSVAFFGTAALLGYTDLPQRAPELSALAVAVSLSLPMAVWMRFRGMPWRPTLEMSGAAMLVGLLPGRLWACRMSADMMHLTEADLYEEVEGIISAADFIEKTEGARLLFV